jgi:hypothetical protein
MATCPRTDEGDGTRWCGCAPNANGLPGQANELRPTCDGAGRFAEITFASMGNPGGDCGAYVLGSCAAPAEAVRAAMEPFRGGNCSEFNTSLVEIVQGL